MALTDKLSAIGSAIREKTGGIELLTLDAMPTAIQGIQAGGGELKTIVASQKYTYNKTASQNNFTIQNDNFPDSGVDFALVIHVDSNTLTYQWGVYDYKASSNSFSDYNLNYRTYLAPTAYDPQTHTLSFKYDYNGSFSTSATTYFKITFA